MDEHQKTEGPGRALRAAREQAGFTIEYVARSLNLEKSVVVALEEDDVSHLPEPAYVKGYLRAYARLLELDAKALMEAYGDLGVPSPEVVPLESVAPSGDHRVGVQVIGGLVALVLIVLSGWWFTRPRPTPVPAPQAEVGQTTEQPSKQGLANSTSVGSTAADATVATIGAPTAESSYTQDAAPASTTLHVPTAVAELAPSASSSHTQAVETPPVTSSKTPTSISSTTAGAVTVSLQLNEKSWVQIQDGSGKQLVRGLLGAGTHRVLSGTPPFSVFLGYAPGVVLSIDGQTVDAGKYIRSNHTARFVLSADGNTHR